MKITFVFYLIGTIWGSSEERSASIINHFVINYFFSIIDFWIWQHYFQDKIQQSNEYNNLSIVFSCFFIFANG